MMFLALLVAAAFAQCNEVSWIQTDDGQTCAGACTKCAKANDYACEAAVAVGPCAATSTKDKPLSTMYIVNIPMGMAAIEQDDVAYLSDPAKASVVDSALNGFKYAENKDDKNYAFVMAGLNVGKADDYGFVGQAHYIMKKGEEKTKFNEIKYLTGTTGTATDTVKVCITDVTNGKCDGADRTFSSGDYKFTIFGATRMKGVDAKYKYIGFRQKLMLVGTTGTDLKVNGKSMKDNANADVKTMTIKVASGDELDLTFPTKYNVGNTAKPAGQDYIHVDATKTVKIKVSEVKGTDGKTVTSEVYVDYLFSADDFRVKDRYFVYDPTVKGKTAGSSAAGLATMFAFVFALLFL